MGLFAEPLTKEEMYLNYLNGNGGIDNLPNPLTTIEKYLYNLCLNNNISDNSSSKYIDIGTVRIQWGRVASNAGASVTINLPVPFANTSYSAIATMSATNNGYLYSVVTRSLTTTSFGTYKTVSISSNPATACTSEGFDWFAIGVKP